MVNNLRSFERSELERKFDFISDRTVFKVDVCYENPSPSTLRGV